jgi:peptide deformylase
MKRAIVSVPHPVLSTPAKRITTFDKKLHDLVAVMTDTLLVTVNPKGVGLAATQIGVGSQVFITKPNAQSNVRVFINPIILDRDPSVTDGIPERGNKLEGCLSIPNVWGKVKRTTKLKLQYQDETGEIHVEEFSGFLATIIQHETDHINGILFTQRVLEQKGKLYQVGKDDEGKEELQELTI